MCIELNLVGVLSAGFDAVVSDQFYLDRQVPVDGLTTWFWVDTWAFMYDTNLTTPGTSNADRGTLLGAEACVWTEQVAEKDVLARTFPRLAGMAERSWSPATVTYSGNAAQRLAVHRCRMETRGTHSGPVWSDFCAADLLGSMNDAGDKGDEITLAKADLVGALFGTAVMGVLVYLLVAYLLRSCCSSDNVPPTVVAAVSSSRAMQTRDGDLRAEHPDRDIHASEKLLNEGSDGAGGAIRSDEDSAKVRRKKSQRLVSLDVTRGAADCP